MHPLLRPGWVLEEPRKEETSTALALKENRIAASAVLRDKLPQKGLSAGAIAQSGSEDFKNKAIMQLLAEKIVGGKNIITLGWNLTVTLDLWEGCPLGRCRLAFSTQM